MQTCKYITKAFAYKSTRIAVLHVYTKKDGDMRKRRAGEVVCTC